MALNNVSDLLQGIKRLFVGMQGVKSDLTMETIKTNDAGALKVSAELTGSNVEQTIGSAIPSKANLIGISDGTNIRPMSGILEGTALVSAARTATTSVPVITNYTAKGIVVFLNVSVASGIGGLQVRIRFLDPVSGNPVAINAAPTAIAAIGTFAYLVYPGASATAPGAVTYNVVQVTPASITKNISISITHGDTSSYTYSVGYALLN